MRWLNHWRLKSKDPKIRERAINALCHDAGAGEIKFFAIALHDENALVRAAAARAIGVLRATRAEPCIQTLVPGLKSSDLTWRRNAGEALELLGWNPATSEERLRWAIALGNFDKISAAEESAMELLLAELKIGSPTNRIAVAETFARFETRMNDKRIVEQLIALLDDPDLTVRFTALQALSNSEDERRLAPLLKLIKSEYPNMRASAVEAIGKTGRADFLPLILPLLKDPKFEVRVSAITALGYVKSAESLTPILGMLKDTDTDVRKAAVDSLARLRDPRSIRPLIVAMIDKESVVRHSAMNALQIINLQWRISEEAKRAIPELEAALNDEEYWVRESAAKALQRIKNF